jgi:DNA polymerase I-like protein with 3'-5' exonuclease and polymerase domains
MVTEYENGMRRMVGILLLLSTGKQVLKTTCLAILYGAFPKKIHETLTLSGETITLNECQDIYDIFWSTFDRVSKFKEYITKVNRKQGYLVSLFGFRGTPHIKDSFNWTIQSSLNGVIINFLEILQNNFPEMSFHTLIHDEILLDIPQGLEEDFKIAHKKSQIQLNNLLGWDVESRFGLNFGNNYLEIK